MYIVYFGIFHIYPAPGLAKHTHIYIYIYISVRPTLALNMGQLKRRISVYVHVCVYVYIYIYIYIYIITISRQTRATHLEVSQGHQTCAIVTLSLRCTIFPIFDLKNVVTLKSRSEGQRSLKVRSLKVVPFDRLRMVSC